MSVRLDHGEDELTDIHEINVTPFIDVILVLLIIFMIAAPLATVDVNVNLPGLTAEPQKRPDKPIFLTIKADHSLAIGDNPVSRDELASALLGATNGDKSQPIFLRADKSLPYGDFAEVINLLRRSGFLKVALVGLETDKNPVSNDLAIPSERTQGLLRWAACFVAVVLLHAYAIAKLLEHSDINDAPPGSEAVEFDVALGDFTPEQQRMDYTPANPVQQEVKPKEQPEEKDAELLFRNRNSSPNQLRPPHR